jgi:DNA-binding transcriptional MocR family regulator
MSLNDLSDLIRHDSFVPVAAQVARDIERDIGAGRLAPDTRLPNEQELVQAVRRNQDDRTSRCGSATGQRAGHHHSRPWFFPVRPPRQTRAREEEPQVTAHAKSSQSQVHVTTTAFRNGQNMRDDLLMQRSIV